MITCCYPPPHLLVANKFLSLSEADWNWMKLTETDWNWQKIDRKWIECRQESGGKAIEIDENWLRRFRMEDGVKEHLTMNTGLPSLSLSARAGKNNELNFQWPKMARLGPRFGPQIWKIPPKKFMWVPFLRPFPGNEAHNIFRGGPKCDVLGGGQKVYVEKVYVGKPWPCYRGHLGPSGRKLQIESEKGFPGPPGPEAQKVQNGVEKESKSTIFQLFWLFLDSVLDFLGPGALFRTLFATFGPKGPNDPCSGQKFSQSLCAFSALSLSLSLSVGAWRPWPLSKVSDPCVCDWIWQAGTVARLACWLPEVRVCHQQRSGAAIWTSC